MSEEGAQSSFIESNPHGIKFKQPKVEPQQNKVEPQQAKAEPQPIKKKPWQTDPPTLRQIQDITHRSRFSKYELTEKDMPSNKKGAQDLQKGLTGEANAKRTAKKVVK